MENVVLLMSANHCGKEDPAGDVEYVGQSAIIAPWGEPLAEVREGEGVAVAEVDFDQAMQWHNACAPYRADRRRWGF
jgi:predicted amidohydrolase